MANYTKTTNFGAKDLLPEGDADKVIRGTEFDTEFDNIATAVASKANRAAPTFTGTATGVNLSLSGTLDVTGNITGSSIELTEDDNSASPGPTITLNRDNTIGEIDDELGEIVFKGKTEGAPGPANVDYGRIYAQIDDEQTGDHEGAIVIDAAEAGSLARIARFSHDDDINFSASLAIGFAESYRPNATLDINGYILIDGTLPEVLFDGCGSFLGDSIDTRLSWYSNNFTEQIRVDNSNVVMPNLPTSDPAVAGALWIDTAAGRVLKVSAG